MEEGSIEFTLAGELLCFGSAALDQMRSLVIPDAFANKNCRAVYEAACAVQDREGTVAGATILAEMQKTGSEPPNGFVKELLTFATTTASTRTESEALMDAYELRKLREILSTTLLEMPAIGKAEDVIMDLEDKLKDVVVARESPIIESAEAAQRISDLRTRLESGTYSPFVETGFSTLDSAFGGGLIRGGFYIIAARPGVGKTALGLAVASQACMLGKRVLIISLEMTVDQLTARYLAMKTGIGSTRILVDWALSDQDSAILRSELGRLPGNGPMYNRKRRVTVSDISFMARKSKADLVIIDYLGLIRPTEGRGRYEQITIISGELKSMALDMNIPILCLAQLNRQTQDTADKPKLADLRDSGAIEQDADGVLMLYRPNQPEPNGNTILSGYVAKNRHGIGGGTVDFYYRPATNWIDEASVQVCEQPASTGYAGDDEPLPF